MLFHIWGGGLREAGWWSANIQSQLARQMRSLWFAVVVSGRPFVECVVCFVAKSERGSNLSL